MSIKSFNIIIKKHGRQLVGIKDFQYEENKINFLFGESGIGKSLISKAIYGIIDPTEFNILINGKSYNSYQKSQNVKEIQKNSFFVFQEPSSHLNPLMTLNEQLHENILSNKATTDKILKRLWNINNSNMQQNILQVYPKPHRPSGGEKQRILLAMAFTKIEMLKRQISDNTKTFFVFDEPSGSLDNYFRNIFLAYLFELFRTYQFTVLLITHDYSIISAAHSYGKDIINAITFKELSLQKKNLTLNEFSPCLYTNWLGIKKNEDTNNLQSSIKPALLRVEGAVEVFGRKLLISKNDNDVPCSLEIYPKSIVYIKAPSGTGKTTFVKSIMGLNRVERLRLTHKNINLTEAAPKKYWQRYIWGKQMAITFQHADEALNQNSKVKGAFSGLSRNVSVNNIRNLMRELFDSDIDDNFLNKKIKYLSGGQKQKLNLLRSLILDTDIVILDEPLNGLDFTSIVKVLAIIEKKRMEGKGIIIISHNEEIFDSIVHPENIYHLYSKEIV